VEKKKGVESRSKVNARRVRAYKFLSFSLSLSLSLSLSVSLCLSFSVSLRLKFRSPRERRSSLDVFYTVIRELVGAATVMKLFETRRIIVRWFLFNNNFLDTFRTRWSFLPDLEHRIRIFSASLARLTLIYTCSIWGENQRSISDFRFIAKAIAQQYAFVMITR